MNSALTPTAPAARASTGTNSRCPPERYPARQATAPNGWHRTRQDKRSRPYGQTAEIGNQIVVAERDAALADQQDIAPLSFAATLATTFFMSPRGEELALLDIHRLRRNPPRPRGNRSVGRGRPGFAARPDLACRGRNLPGSCTSVSTGTPICRRTSSRMRRPASRPGPRADLPELRFALS